MPLKQFILPGVNSTVYAFQYGIYTNKSTAYQIEGNDFISQPSFGSLGPSIRNSGLEDNEVYKNRMTNMAFGAVSFGKNRNDFIGGPIGAYKGLEFLCNENINNERMDIAISTNDALDGAKLEQGLLAESAGNTFTLVNDRNIESTLPASIYTKYYFDNGLNKEPLNNSINIDKIITPNNNLCPTHFNVVNPGPFKPVIFTFAQLKSKYDSLKIDYTAKKEVLSTLEANGDRPELYTAVNNLNFWNLYSTWIILHNEAPYLSESILRELGNKVPWVFPNYLLKHLIIDNIEVARNPDFMEFLETKQYPMPHWYIESIRNASQGNITTKGIQQSELVGLSREMHRTANLAIKNLVHDTINADPQLYNEWIIRRGDVLCELQLVDNYLDKGQKTDCSLRMALINGQISQLTAGRLKTELEDYYNFKNEMLALTKANGALQGLDSISEPIVRQYAENATGYAQVQAQNLLCFWLGECEEAPEPPLGLGNKSMLLKEESMTEEEALINLFALYPNPSSDLITIELTELTPDSKIKIIDINGRVLYENKARNLKTTIDIASYQKGVYIVLVQSVDNLIEREKLIIQ